MDSFLDISDLERELGLAHLSPMDADASTRRFFRADDRVLMVDREEGGEARLLAFDDVARRIRNAGLRAPEIYKIDAEAGYALMEDFGEFSLKDRPTEHNYYTAYDGLRNLQIVSAEGLPLYSEAIYSEELSRLIRFYLEPLGKSDHTIMELAQPFLEELAYESAHFVHLDYHAENLMVLDDGILGMIDFQDARMGHRLYDLASFVDDVRVPLDDGVREGYLSPFSPADRRIVEIISAQRLIKILGIFARLTGEGRQKYALMLLDVYARILARLEHEDLKLWREWFLDVVPEPDYEVLKKLSLAGLGLESENLSVDA